MSVRNKRDDRSEEEEGVGKSRNPGWQRWKSSQRLR